MKCYQIGQIKKYSPTPLEYNMWIICAMCFTDRPPPTLCFNLKTLHIAGCPGSHGETVRHAPATSNPQRSENFRVPERIYHGVNDGVADGRKSRSVGVDHRGPGVRHQRVHGKRDPTEAKSAQDGGEGGDPFRGGRRM